MAASFDLVEVDRLLTTTRAVRKRLDLTRPVPRRLLLECIDLAVQAPTGGNTQRWRWLVVTDKDKRAGLAELYRKAYQPYIEAQQRAVAEIGRSDADRIIDSSTYLADHLHEVPVHVIPCALDRPPTGDADGHLSGFFGSIVPAVWSLQLALRSRGLASAWTTLHLRYEREAAELLGIPTTVTQVALLPVAHSIGTEFKRASRKPAAEVTYFDAWKGR